jgi:tripartite-type tricarboxylate transporter receptor subunit TctC
MKRLLCLFLLACSLTVQAQSFATKPVRIIIPWPVGNTADLIARGMQDLLAANLGQPVVVENRVGAAGMLAVEYVAKSAPDGHVLMLTNPSPLTLNPAVYKKMPYDPLKDIAAVSVIGGVPVMLVGNPQLPFNTLQELVAYVKANPGKLYYGSAGRGTFTHLTMELVKQAVGLDIIHVPYKGAVASLTDVVSGQTALMLDGFASSNAMLKAGRLKAFAISSPQRSPFAPQVPTFMESGVHGLESFEFSAWQGLFAPGTTSPALVERINAEVSKLLQTAQFRERLMAQSITPYPPLKPSVFQAMVADDLARWTKTAREANVEMLD